MWISRSKNCLQDNIQPNKQASPQLVKQADITYLVDWGDAHEITWRTTKKVQERDVASNTNAYAIVWASTKNVWIMWIVLTFLKIYVFIYIYQWEKTN